MSRRALLATDHSEDAPLVAALFREGFDVYLVNHSRNQDRAQTALVDAINSFMPEIVLIADDFDSHVVETALQIHNAPDNRPALIVFLTPKNPAFPSYRSKFRKGDIHFLTRPYARGEVEVHVKRISATERAVPPISSCILPVGKCPTTSCPSPEKEDGQNVVGGSE